MGLAEVSEMLPLMGVPVKSFQSYEHTPGLELPLSFFSSLQQAVLFLFPAANWHQRPTYPQQTQRSGCLKPGRTLI